jgi:hypothetical protein
MTTPKSGNLMSDPRGGKKSSNWDPLFSFDFLFGHEKPPPLHLDLKQPRQRARGILATCHSLLDIERLCHAEFLLRSD